MPHRKVFRATGYQVIDKINNNNNKVSDIMKLSFGIIKTHFCAIGADLWP